MTLGIDLLPCAGSYLCGESGGKLEVLSGSKAALHVAGRDPLAFREVVQLAFKQKEALLASPERAHALASELLRMGVRKFQKEERLFCLCRHLQALFDCLRNLINGKGFHTTVSLAALLATELFAVKSPSPRRPTTPPPQRTKPQRSEEGAPSLPETSPVEEQAPMFTAFTEAPSSRIIEAVHSRAIVSATSKGRRAGAFPPSLEKASLLSSFSQRERSLLAVLKSRIGEVDINSLGKVGLFGLSNFFQQFQTPEKLFSIIAFIADKEEGLLEDEAGQKVIGCALSFGKEGYVDSLVEKIAWDEECPPQLLLRCLHWLCEKGREGKRISELALETLFKAYINRGWINSYPPSGEIIEGLELLFQRDPNRESKIAIAEAIVKNLKPGQLLTFAVAIYEREAVLRRANPGIGYLASPVRDLLTIRYRENVDFRSLALEKRPEVARYLDPHSCV